MKLGMRIFSATLLLIFMVVATPMASSKAHAAPCYWARFIADMTIPDGTSFAASTAFTKTWRIKNIGACAWNTGDVSLIFDSGERMNAPTSMLLPKLVYPGQTVDITVNMTAPSMAGHYFGYWKLQSYTGGVFGIGSQANRSFWVEIFVTSLAGSGYDFTANASSATWSSGAGHLSFPGVDGSPAGFGIKQDTPTMENGVAATQPGLLFSPQNVWNGYVQAAYPALRVQSGDRFKATIGCEYGAAGCYVSYKLYYQIGTGPIRTYWTFNEKYEGWIYNVNLDLSPLANQDVKFTLAIYAHGSANGDRALWVNPTISRVGAPSTPTATPSPLPDLAITNVYLGMQGVPNSSPNCVLNYGPYEIRATIQNRGQAQAINIPVVDTATGTQLMIGLLRAGQSMELYFPANSPGATHTLVVDPQNVIPELDENNNVFSYLAVTPTPPAICTPAVTPTFTPIPTAVP